MGVGDCACHGAPMKSEDSLKEFFLCSPSTMLIPEIDCRSPGLVTEAFYRPPTAEPGLEPSIFHLDFQHYLFFSATYSHNSKHRQNWMLRFVVLVFPTSNSKEFLEDPWHTEQLRAWHGWGMQTSQSGRWSMLAALCSLHSPLQQQCRDKVILSTSYLTQK